MKINIINRNGKQFSTWISYHAGQYCEKGYYLHVVPSEQVKGITVMSITQGIKQLIIPCNRRNKKHENYQPTEQELTNLISKLC